MEEVTLTTIISFTTLVITYIFGILSKKFGWLESKYIPFQNALIGIIAGVIAFVLGLVEDLATAVIICVISAFGAGGGYDLVQKSKGINEEEK